MLFKILKHSLCIISVLGISSVVLAQNAYKVNNKTYTMDDIKKDHTAELYEIKKQEYDFIDKLAQNQYLETYFQELATKEKKSVDQARMDYITKKTKINPKEEKELMKTLKDHPQFKALSAKEQKEQVRSYLTMKQGRQVLEDLIEAAKKAKKIEILIPKPQEPVYDLEVTDKDMVRYSQELSSTKPVKCSSDCPITVVEYSEFQCPYCSRTLPVANQLMKEFKGKIRWVVRDFPLDFHDRARPAAIAAHCAAEQGKYWFMYKTLFENQQKLQDADLEGYATSIKGIDVNKWKSCLKDPVIVATIDKNVASGIKVGVNGTPAFYINGKKLDTGMSFETVKAKIKEELKAKK